MPPFDLFFVCRVVECSYIIPNPTPFVNTFFLFFLSFCPFGYYLYLLSKLLASFLSFVTVYYPKFAYHVRFFVLPMPAIHII